ncbi:MAG: zinc ribbon domain-containing protein, partial [Deltaproteobacteria bacterium]|nr:zinc ribbon domain-containing protein [Deltaproteobacteria bacterium]
PAPTAGPDGDELPLLTGVLSTPAKGVPAPAEVTATFGRPGSFLGDDNEEAEGAMPPPVDFDKLTLAGPAMLQPPSAAPEPELLEEVEPEPAAPADPVEPLELVEAEEVVAAPAPPALAASCPSCGAERIPSARFCPHCGCSFTGAPRAAATTPPVRVTGAVPLSSVSPTGDRGAGDVRAAREPSSLVLLAWHASSEAGRADDVDVLLGRATSGEPHLSPALGLVDLPSDAAWVDEPAALAGARAGETVGRAFAYVRRSANTDVDAPEAMLAAAPRKRSLAADWADVAERPIARKEHGTAELAVQRGRDLLLLATPEEEQPAAPAPEPEIAYEPAEPEHAANPAPWAAFAGAPDEKK